MLKNYAKTGRAYEQALNMGEPLPIVETDPNPRPFGPCFARQGP
jgi:hypothetical protein